MLANINVCCPLAEQVGASLSGRFWAFWPLLSTPASSWVYRHPAWAGLSSSENPDFDQGYLSDAGRLTQIVYFAEVHQTESAKVKDPFLVYLYQKSLIYTNVCNVISPCYYVMLLCHAISPCIRIRSISNFKKIPEYSISGAWIFSHSEQYNRRCLHQSPGQWIFSYPERIFQFSIG